MLTTHYLEEADAQAERVLVIDHGKIIADDTADGLKRRWPVTGSRSPWMGRCRRGGGDLARARPGASRSETA